MSKNETQASVAEAGVILPDEETVRIKIPKDRNDKREVLFVSIGMRNFIVKIGEWVEVPMCVAKVLRRREERMEASEKFINRSRSK